MTQAHIIDGRSLSQARTQILIARSHQIKLALGRPPRLAVILVGDDPASHTYVHFKTKRCSDLNIDSTTKVLKSTIEQSELMEIINSLNQDKTVDGILLQLPLPDHLDENKAVQAILPHKDVDGLHPLNQGNLLQGNPTMVPCTPQGCLDIIHSCCDNISDCHVVIVGRSILVGRPLAALLLNNDATVTVAHSKTSNLKSVCQMADILVVATGQPQMITGDFVKPGAIVIDVGQSHVNNRVIGDVEPVSVAHKASYLTPATGGVGPMTIINLMENVLHAAESHIPE